MLNNPISFVLLRLAVALSMFGHGLVRLPKLAGFSKWMTGSFEKSILPQTLVVPFSYALPMAEFVVGLLLLIGLFTRAALIGGAVVMLMLIFGTTMIEEWNSLPSQLIHMAFFALLLNNVHLNHFSVDRALKQPRQ